jgi:creatinine amidohydrolase/Fe(II)-dependent formamide hydrolase-like protein
VTGSAGNIGEAKLASKQKGERLFTMCVEEVAAFLEDFNAWG